MVANGLFYAKWTSSLCKSDPIYFYLMSYVNNLNKWPENDCQNPENVINDRKIGPLFQTGPEATFQKVLQREQKISSKRMSLAERKVQIKHFLLLVRQNHRHTRELYSIRNVRQCMWQLNFICK